MNKMTKKHARYNVSNISCKKRYGHIMFYYDYYYYDLFASKMHIKSTNISISSADNKGQLRTPSLTNNNSSKNNTEALCCVEICELT